MNDSKTSGGNGDFTIADAIAEYRANKQRLDGIGALADFLVSTNADVLAYPNDSYGDALRLTEVMLRHTHRQFVILTGGACGGFYITLLDPLRDALNRIRDSGGKGRMIILSETYPEWLRALAEDYKGTLEIASANPSLPKKHFIVCDSTMVREEELHGELTLSSKADLIKAKVHFNNPAKGNELEGMFDSLWSASETDKSAPQRKTQAPSWLVYQMEASRHRRLPTSATVEKQFRSVEEGRKTYASNSKP